MSGDTELVRFANRVVEISQGMQARGIMITVVGEDHDSVQCISFGDQDIMTQEILLAETLKSITEVQRVKMKTVGIGRSEI